MSADDAITRKPEAQAQPMRDKLRHLLDSGPLVDATGASGGTVITGIGKPPEPKPDEPRLPPRDE